jgi:hypothetical protein
MVADIIATFERFIQTNYNYTRGYLSSFTPTERVILQAIPHDSKLKNKIYKTRCQGQFSLLLGRPNKISELYYDIVCCKSIKYDIDSDSFEIILAHRKDLFSSNEEKITIPCVGTTTNDSERISELEKDNAELKEYVQIEMEKMDVLRLEMYKEIKQLQRLVQTQAEQIQALNEFREKSQNLISPIQSSTDIHIPERLGITMDTLMSMPVVEYQNRIYEYLKTHEREGVLLLAQYPCKAIDTIIKKYCEKHYVSDITCFKNIVKRNLVQIYLPTAKTQSDHELIETYLDTLYNKYKI